MGILFVVVQLMIHQDILGDIHAMVDTVVKQNDNISI